MLWSLFFTRIRSMQNFSLNSASVWKKRAISNHSVTLSVDNYEIDRSKSITNSKHFRNPTPDHGLSKRFRPKTFYCPFYSILPPTFTSKCAVPRYKKNIPDDYFLHHTGTEQLSISSKRRRTIINIHRRTIFFIVAIFRSLTLTWVISPKWPDIFM